MFTEHVPIQAYNTDIYLPHVCYYLVKSYIALTFVKVTNILRGSSFFWNVTERRLIVNNRRCGAKYRSHLQRSGSPKRLFNLWRWDG